MQAPLIGICRHRLSVDGAGVTTLVAFHGCPLHCRYCLNPQCLKPEVVWRTLTPQEVMTYLQKDDLYFRATGGGMCFGGGEPLLRSAFIRELCKLMPAAWSVTVETSLNVPWQHVEEVMPLVRQWIIDVKDMNPDIYHRYTTTDNARVKDNLRRLQENTTSILVRLPRIPDYNTPADIAASRKELEALGITHFEEFDYQVR